MKYRKLRIAWSVALGILCLLIISLWVRSHWRRDFYTAKPFGVRSFNVLSIRGCLRFITYKQKTNRPRHLQKNSPAFESLSLSIPKFAEKPNPTVPGAVLGFGFHTEPLTNARTLLLPYWSLVVMFALLAATSWYPHLGRRFSLRTLLIATTLVAVALGLIVAAAR